MLKNEVRQDPMKVASSNFVSIINRPPTHNTRKDVNT
jgi:hypothetical protein